MRKIIYLKSRPKAFAISSKYFSLAFMACGFLLIALAIWPIISFNILVAPKFMSMVKPVPDSLLVKTNQQHVGFGGGFLGVKGNIVEAQENEKNTENSEFTKASVWFPKKPAIIVNQEEALVYTLSIPKLKVKDAKVMIGSDDLKKSLIQYGGTANPGNYGNTVIFGHSVLPYFFNPKDYKTIFSTLPSLSEGDEIFIINEGITYRYVIEEMHVVDPSDVSILEQKYDDSYLSLITCVPPGTYEKRLWVKARLQKI